MDNKEKYIVLLTKLYVEGNFNFETNNELLTLKAHALNISDEERSQLHDSRSKYYPMVVDFINKIKKLNNEDSTKEEVTSYCQDLGLYNEETQLLVQNLIKDKTIVSQTTESQQNNSTSTEVEFEEKEHLMKSIVKAATFWPSSIYKIALPLGRYNRGGAGIFTAIISVALWPVWIGSFVLAFLYRRFVMKSVNNVMDS